MIENVIVGSLAVNCWIIPLDETNTQTKPAPAIVIDPGDDASLIIARLETLRLFPQYILLTHGHFDHTGAVADLMEYSSEQKPTLAIHEADAPFVHPETRQAYFEAHLTPLHIRYASVIWASMPIPTRLLKEGESIGPFRVMHTPGHSLGSVCFFDEERKRLFSGDTLFAGGIGRSDGPGGNTELIGKSLQKLLRMDKNIEVFPGHGPTTTIGAEL